MNFFLQRRFRNIALLLLALGLAAFCMRVVERGLGRTEFLTGYSLLAMIVFLALYNVRKKLPFLPLGNASAWLQWHIYVALGSGGVFALHAGLALPSGILERCLSGLYLLTFCSGLAGLYLSR